MVLSEILKCKRKIVYLSFSSWRENRLYSSYIIKPMKYRIIC